MIRWFEEVRGAPSHLSASEGIDGLSLNPDSQLKTMLVIVDVEKRLANGALESAPARVTQ